MNTIQFLNMNINATNSVLLPNAPEAFFGKASSGFTGQLRVLKPQEGLCRLEGDGKMAGQKGEEGNGLSGNGKRDEMWSPIFCSCILDRDFQKLHYKEFLVINHVMIVIVLGFCVY